jgi:hypothetical protein
LAVAEVEDEEPGYFFQVEHDLEPAARGWQDRGFP